MNKANKYQAKGYITFYYSSTEEVVGIASKIVTIDDLVADAMKYYTPSEETKQAWQETIEQDFLTKISHLIRGDKFLDMVVSGSITDYDGYVCNVFVDGCNSNLGICTDGLTGGEFLVDANTWRKLCNEHVIEVDWANK